MGSQLSESEDSEPQYNGGCFCGNIRYQVRGNPDWAGHCHCNICWFLNDDLPRYPQEHPLEVELSNQ